MDWLHCILKSLNSFKNYSSQSIQDDISEENILKSFKDRFNYASLTCSARILSHNPESLSVSSVLSPNKDAYMRSLCSLKNKFIVLELCEDVKVDGIVLGNYELFSSTFKGFKVYAAIKSNDPNQQIIWKLLLDAKMSLKSKHLHSDQGFLIESGLFFKYLRIEFDDEYFGNEELCPLSTIKVYGKNMIDEYKEVSKSSGNDLINYESSLQLSKELKSIYKEMEEISLKLKEADTKTTSIFINYCPIEDSEHELLKDYYSKLEKQAVVMRETAVAASKSNGNVFKLINDRINKLEITLKNPLNMILFRSINHPDNNDKKDTTQKTLLYPSTSQSSTDTEERSFEEIFSILNQDLFNLKSDYKRIESILSHQQSKINLLILFNSLLFLIILAQFLLRKRVIGTALKTSNSSHGALKRRPLLDLKSPNSLASSLSSSDISASTPGVVLSDDEVLLLDEEDEHVKPIL